MILIFLGEDFFGFYYFIIRYSQRHKMNGKNADFYVIICLFQNYSVIL